MKETIKEYTVPFKLEGEFVVRARHIADLKKKMDGMIITDLLSSAVNVEINAYPDRATKINEYSNKIKVKTITNK